MSRARAKFTEADVYRAVRGATRAGVTVGRVVFEPDKFVIIIGGGPQEQPPNDLDRELEEFKQRHGQV